MDPEHVKRGLKTRFERRFTQSEQVEAGWSVSGSGRLGTQPGRVLEDAFWAGVVDELLTTDEALLHGHLAPGAEAIGEVG